MNDAPERSSRRPGAKFLALFSLLTLALSSEGRAESKARAAVIWPPCPGDPAASQHLQRALELELSAQGVELVEIGEAFASGDVLIEVGSLCSASQTSVLVRLNVRGQQSERRLELVDLKERDRPRLLALAIGEFLDSALQARPAAPGLGESISADTEAATRSDSSTPSTPPVAPSEKQSTVKKKHPTHPQTPRARIPASSSSFAALQPAEAPAARTRLALAPAFRHFFEGNSMWGAQARVEMPLVWFGVDYFRGGAQAIAGDISATLAHASFGLRGSEYSPTRDWSLGWGPRLGLGMLWVAGSPRVSSASGGGLLETYIDVALSGVTEIQVNSLTFGARVELGYAHGVTALVDGAPAANFGGPLTSAELHAAFDL